MSLHKEDYLAAAKKVTDFAAAHPTATWLVLAVLVAFIAGYALG